MGKKDKPPKDESPKHKKEKNEKPVELPAWMPRGGHGPICPPHDPDTDDWSSDARCRRCGQPC